MSKPLALPRTAGWQLQEVSSSGRWFYVHLRSGEAREAYDNGMIGHLMSLDEYQAVCEQINAAHA